MAYIKDYVIEENQSSDSLKYLEPVDLKFSDFERDSGQVYFKFCDLSIFRADYLFKWIANPKKYLDDEEFVQNYESISTLLINANKGPIIIKENVFQENIGTIGGAVHIMSPDFESTKAMVN